LPVEPTNSFLAVLERDVGPLARFIAVLGRSPRRGFPSRQQRGLGPAAWRSSVRRACFDIQFVTEPSVFFVEINPRVWIDPLDLGDRPCSLTSFFASIFTRKNGRAITGTPAPMRPAPPRHR
jgi:hypothetical protein